jgi:hypothetical protein
MRRIILSSAFLSKLAKHLAVLACLAIVGETSGRFVIGQKGILVLVVSAALLHSAARALQRRLHPQFRCIQTQDVHRRGAEHAEFGVFFDQKLFTLRPPRS